MELAELKVSLHDKVKGLSNDDLEAALGKALLDCNIAIALAGGRGAIAADKLAYGVKGFEVDKKYYLEQETIASSELKVLFEYKQSFQDWLEEVRQSGQEAA